MLDWKLCQKLSPCQKPWQDAPCQKPWQRNYAKYRYKIHRAKNCNNRHRAKIYGKLTHAKIHDNIHRANNRDKYHAKNDDNIICDKKYSVKNRNNKIVTKQNHAKYGAKKPWQNCHCLVKSWKNLKRFYYSMINYIFYTCYKHGYVSMITLVCHGFLAHLCAKSVVPNSFFLVVKHSF